MENNVFFLRKRTDFIDHFYIYTQPSLHNESHHDLSHKQDSLNNLIIISLMRVAIPIREKIA
jgi:hypothetical protein